MTAQQDLVDGSSRNAALSQFFTPPALAERVVQWALTFEDWVRFRPNSIAGRSIRVLEPSAGNGALVRPLVAAGAEVTALEIDERYASDLRRELGSWGFLGCPTNFRSLKSPPWQADFDLCVMNPPYEQKQDVAFILHALKFAPRVVGIFRSALLHGAWRKKHLWSQVRATRIAFLAERPQFDATGGSPRSDFIVAELVARTEGHKLGGIDTCDIEHW